MTKITHVILVALLPIVAVASLDRKTISYERPVHPLVKGMAALVIEQYSESSSDGLDSGELNQAVKDLIQFKFMPPPPYPGMEPGELDGKMRMNNALRGKDLRSGVGQVVTRAMERYDKSADGRLQLDELVKFIQGNAAQMRANPGEGPCHGSASRGLRFSDNKNESNPRVPSRSPKSPDR